MFRPLGLSFRLAAPSCSIRPCSRSLASHARPLRNWTVVSRRAGLLTAFSAVTAIALYLHTQNKVLLDAKLPAAPVPKESEPGSTRKDPATGIEFPETLVIPSRVRLPPFQLLGLGVRTVSFLGIKVYSVGFYADLSSLKFNQIPENLTPEEKVDYVVSNTACVLRLSAFPTRNTSYSHLRDGFMRALQGRMSKQLKEGSLSTQEAEEAQSPLRKLKSMFPSSRLKKGEPLDVLLLAPPKNPGEKRTLIVRDLGSLENNWVAKQFFMCYFVGNGISPAMKNSVLEFLQSRQISR